MAFVLWGAPGPCKGLMSSYSLSFAIASLTGFVDEQESLKGKVEWSN